MTPHKQLFHHQPEAGVFGDCYRTCIGSLLDLRPEEVPHEHRLFEDGEMRRFMDRFLAPRGLALMFMAFNCEPADIMAVMAVANPGMFYLLSGTSRTGCNHVVIARDDQIVHDPSLTDAGIIGRCSDGHTYVEWLVPRLLIASETTEGEMSLSAKDLALRTTLPPPVKEAEPEPVAWAFELAGGIDANGKGCHWTPHLSWTKPTVPHGMIRNLRALSTTPPALQARGPRDAMLDRSEEEWEALEEATVQVYSLRAGHTLTDDDIAALHLVDRCQREDEESATDAYHRGLETGLRKRGGDELVNLEKRVNDAIISRATEKAMRGLAEQRANAAEFVLSLCLAALQARVEALEGVTRDLRDRLLAFVGAVAEITDCSADVDAINRADALLDRAALTGEKG